MRRIVALVGLLAAITLLVAGTRPASADPPGSNGEIKVHAGDTESEPVVHNEPHPGTSFHVHGFNFDANATGTWWIMSWPPTGDTGRADQREVVASGTWASDASGAWRTGTMSGCELQASGESGHFKVFAHQDGAPGGDKHKVFWIECAAAPSSAASTPTPTPTLTPTPTPTPTTPTPTPTPNPAGIVPGEGGPTPSPSPTPTPAPTVAGVQQPPTAGVAPIVEVIVSPAPIVGGVIRPPAAEVPGVGQVTQPTQAGEVTQPVAVPLPAEMAGQPAGIGSLPSTSTATNGLPSVLLFLLVATALRRAR